MSDVHVYMHKFSSLGGFGGILPKEINFVELRLLLKLAIWSRSMQSCFSYMARIVSHPVFAGPYSMC